MGAWIYEYLKVLREYFVMPQLNEAISLNNSSKFYRHSIISWLFLWPPYFSWTYSVTPLVYMTPYLEKNESLLHSICNLPTTSVTWLPGTKLPAVTVTGRDQTGRLGQTGLTSKNPMWAGVNGTQKEKSVRDCESQWILKCDCEWNNKILMWACVNGTGSSKFLDL